MNLIYKTEIYEKLDLYRKVAIRYGKEKMQGEIIVPSLFINIISKDGNAIATNNIIDNVQEMEKELLYYFLKRKHNKSFGYTFDSSKNGRENIRSFISALEVCSEHQSEYFGVIHVDVSTANVANLESRKDYELFLNFIEENKQKHWLICFYATNLSDEQYKLMELITKKHIFIDSCVIKLENLSGRIENELFKKYSISLADTCITQIGDMLEDYEAEEKIDLVCSSSVVQELAFNLVKDAVVDERVTEYDDMKGYIDKAYVKNSNLNSRKTIGFCQS